jgi:hypothetical protein
VFQLCAFVAKNFPGWIWLDLPGFGPIAGFLPPVLNPQRQGSGINFFKKQVETG